MSGKGLKVEAVGEEPYREPLRTGSQLRGDSYTIVRQIGDGGFSLAYRALQGPWRLPVAIKELFPVHARREADGIRPVWPWDDERFARSLESFLVEGTTLSRFNHPGIVRVLDIFQENHTAYLVEELLEGISLYDRVETQGAADLSVGLELADQIGRALMVIHGGGQVHSDLKPENIYHTLDGRYVLLDFGLARGFLSRGAAEKGERGVTPGYAPPEQYSLDQKLTPAADVYAFAATIYHMLTGFPPVEARDRLEGEPLASIRAYNASVTPKVEEAIVAAMHLDERKRTPKIHDFLVELGLDPSPKGAVYKPPKVEQLTRQRAHRGGTQQVVLHPASGRAFSGGRDGFVRAWSWPQLELLAEYRAHQQPVKALAVSSNGGYLVTGCESGEIKLWDSRLDCEAHLLSQGGAPVTRLCFHPRKGIVAVSYGDGSCALMGPAYPEGVVWGAHQGIINGLEISPRGDWVASCGDDVTVRIWDLFEQQLLTTLGEHQKALQSVRFSPLGDSLLSSSSDLSAKFWELASNLPLREFKGHNALVWDAQFTFDPHLVVTISADLCLRVFRLDSGRLLQCSEAHSGSLKALATDLTQPLVATGGGDGDLAVWRLPALGGRG